MHIEILALSINDPLKLAGWIIIGGLMLQVGLLVGGTARRLWFEKRQRELEHDRLAFEIKAAQVRIQSAEQAKSAWNGVRKFTVRQKVRECADTYSFYLAPHDGNPLPPFKPGQYLTFQMPIPGLSKPLVRCYSLSDCARPDLYRVTIKRCPPAPDTDYGPGVVSSYFCDTVKEGDILDAKAPAGNFYLDLEKPRPVVLISGGVGVTPMVSMANAIIAAGMAREVWFFFGARNSGDHIFKDYMHEIAARHKHVHVHVCYSKPQPTEAKGRDFHHEGRVTVDLMKTLLPSNNYEYFLCGPGAFMESITEDLRNWGVPDESVHFEAFGPASVKRAAKPEVKLALTRPPFGAGIAVAFTKSGKTLTWNGAHASILEMAEERGIKIDAGCRAGNCGSCLIAIKAGEVEYLGEHGADVERGSCLACIARPKGTLVLDA
jgi:uncharacterized protein